MASEDLYDNVTVSLKESAFKNLRLNELRQSLINSNKTKTQSQRSQRQQFPTVKLSQRNLTERQGQKMLSISNRHLRYLYHQFCKQSYIGGAHATFDDIAESAEYMTVNKWMTFCREFGIAQKLSNRDLALIYKTATKEKVLMNLEEFCHAIHIAKQRMRVDPAKFASEVLHVDSHASARKRLCVMKINFSGPKTNFFIQSTLTEKQREKQKKETKEFKQRQRELVLHQGMSKEHIEMYLQQRKNQRRQKMQKLRNKSALYNPEQSRNSQKKSNSIMQKYRKQPLINVPSPTKSIKTKSIFGNYSKIFEIKRANNTGSTQNGSYLIRNNSSLRKKTDQQTEAQSKSRLAFEEQRDNTNQVIRNGLFDNIKQFQQKWEINSQQSDEILKDHFENEKRIKNQSPLKEPNIDQQDFERDTDLMITRYN